MSNKAAFLTKCEIVAMDVKLFKMVIVTIEKERKKYNLSILNPLNMLVIVQKEKKIPLYNLVKYNISDYQESKPPDEAT